MGRISLVSFLFLVILTVGFVLVWPVEAVCAPEPFVEIRVVEPVGLDVDGVGEWFYGECTAYTLRPEECGKRPDSPWWGITSSGVRVEEGVTVAAPRQFPFGTVLEIEGVGYRVVQDRGGAVRWGGYRMKGVKSCIDIYCESYEEAIQFGRRKLRVRVVAWGDGGSLSPDFVKAALANSFKGGFA